MCRGRRSRRGTTAGRRPRPRSQGSTALMVEDWGVRDAGEEGVVGRGFVGQTWQMPEPRSHRPLPLHSRGRCRLEAGFCALPTQLVPRGQVAVWCREGGGERVSEWASMKMVTASNPLTLRAIGRPRPLLVADARVFLAAAPVGRAVVGARAAAQVHETVPWHVDALRRRVRLKVRCRRPWGGLRPRLRPKK